MLVLPDGVSMTGQAPDFGRFVLTFSPHESRWIKTDFQFEFRIPISYASMPPVVTCKTPSDAHYRQREYLLSLPAPDGSDGKFSEADMDDAELIDSSGKVMLCLLQFETNGWNNTYTLTDVVYALQQLLAVPARPVIGRLPRSEHPLLRSPGPAGVPLLAGEAALRGKRPTMEDEATCIAALDAKGCRVVGGHPVGFFAVFDGHGGDNASKHFSANLHGVFVEHLRDQAPGVGGSVGLALWHAFVAADERYLRGLKRTKPDDESGTTAVVAVVAGTTLTVANCGDSRCILSRGGTAVSLTSDHKASRPDEVARVVRCGGFVVRNRVLGALAVSRALGDPAFKTGAGGQLMELGKSLVSSQPQIVETPLASTDEFLVLACDGLFDVMDSQRVVDFARDCLARGDSPAATADALARNAVAEGSTDNVSVVVVKVGDGVPADATLREVAASGRAERGATRRAAAAGSGDGGDSGGRSLAAGLLAEEADGDAHASSPVLKGVASAHKGAAEAALAAGLSPKATKTGDLFIGSGGKSAKKKANDANPFSKGFGRTKAAAAKREHLVRDLRPSWSARHLDLGESPGSGKDGTPSKPPMKRFNSSPIDPSPGHFRSFSSPAHAHGTGPTGTGAGAGAGAGGAVRTAVTESPVLSAMSPEERRELASAGMGLLASSDDAVAAAESGSGSGAGSGAPGKDEIKDEKELMQFLLDDTNFDN